MSPDSRPETLAHIARVRELLEPVVDELRNRGRDHDASKLHEPELAVFDEWTPMLRDITFGSDEYKAALHAMRPALEHHYAHNRHHPQHFANGIAGMTLIDLMEMLADWKASTERHEDGDLVRSFALQRERFGIGDQLQQILVNTALELGWIEPEAA